MTKFVVAVLLSLSSSLCLAGAPLGKFGASTAKLSSLPFNFTIVNWNIYKSGKDGMARDLSMMTRNADVAVLQEAYETPEIVRELTTANQEFSWNIVRGFKYQGYYTGVATGSRVAALRNEGFLSVVKEPILNSPKTMLLSVYPIANSPNSLAVLNVHGINFVLNSEFKKQVAQMVSILKGHQGPMLVAGDFNTWNNGRMNALDKAMGSLGLRRLKLTNQKEAKLDHAYVRGLVATEAVLMTQIKSSDHYPIYLKFQAAKVSAELLQAANH